MVRMIADHKGFRNVAGHVQHHAFLLRPVQELLRPASVACLVEIKNADEIRQLFYPPFERLLSVTYAVREAVANAKL